ncbi:hypothetical protein DPEC_G00036070 [Dallia pectoralis]|uniref:Uncharacterized protein n=1 Tax=Dallia pectoralis TaxID=75939 RepID=A0ACC2HDJ1_DALPE|nr:hypothetical protein DPEC_G00036070 [Dallia pectoralis]
MPDGWRDLDNIRSGGGGFSRGQLLRLKTTIHLSMKRHRQLRLQPLQPLLPTITETLEDFPTVHPLHTAQYQSPTHYSQSPEAYMTSIQALARPVLPPSCGLVRLQRAGRPRLISKAQIKYSVSASQPRDSPRASWTRTPSSINTDSQSSEHLSGLLRMEKECAGQDPMEWLYGQRNIKAETRMHTPSRTRMWTHVV